MSLPAAPSHLAHKPTFLTHENARFLIMDAPTDNNLPGYVEVCKSHNVATIVRACEPTYNTGPLGKAGIQVVELPFTDGDPPPAGVVDKFLDICKAEFKQENRTLAVHCVAGLGRAPVLVVIALVEMGMDPMDAVEFVRKKRRGAINSKQVRWLTEYKPRNKKKDCVIL